jgi:hypothetical protein
VSSSAGRVGDALLAAGATQGYVPLRSTAPSLRAGRQQRTSKITGNFKVNVNTKPRRLYFLLLHLIDSFRATFFPHRPGSYLNWKRLGSDNG